ncbi:MAG: carboxypeptidase M32 [Halobacteriovoraceae bacterium]|nr:carboxypeptidase M32 [Halobacteriovoraceae bacterium]
MSKYESLKSHCKKIKNLEHAKNMLYWDGAVFMPKGGQEARTDALSELECLIKDYKTSPDIISFIEDAKKEKLNEWQVKNLKIVEKEYTRQIVIPNKLTKELSRATSTCEFKWQEYRKENNFKALIPYLQKVFELSKEEAQIISDEEKSNPYDVLLDKFQPGNSQKRIDELFKPLKKELPNLINIAIEKQKETKPLDGDYPIEIQKTFGEEIIQNLGLDFNHARLDVSHHPFCGGVPTDVRITTRYKDGDFTQAFMGIVHETGHACYEQNLPADYLYEPVGSASGIAVHEGQSLFFEMQIARSLEFWKFYSSKVHDTFFKYAKTFDLLAWSPENIYRHFIKVEKSKIRVEADELTYPLHVIMRYEIEKELFSGNINISDLPNIWNEKMLEYLGISTLGDDKDGCMQDVHWPGGGFGYFPVYTQGAMIAAQVKNKMKEELNFDQEIRNGNFLSIKNWLKKNIWSKGALYDMDELLKNATGEKLSGQYLLKHLKERYVGI